MPSTSDARRRPAKAERFAFRLSPEDKSLLERAAALRHTSVTEFVVQSCRDAAHQELADQTRFTLTVDQMRAFMQALDAPPRDVPGLRRLFERASPFGP